VKARLAILRSVSLARQRGDSRIGYSKLTLTVLGFVLEQPAEILARVAKLADAPDLGSGGEILRGSSPLPGTATLRQIG
jgi:hypothetical protein